MSTYKPLTLQLEGWFDTPLCDLPDAIRHRVAEEFFLTPWDSYSAEGRRAVTLQLDYQKDKTTEQVRQFWWDLGARIENLKTQIAEWEVVATPNAGDLALKEAQLAKFRQELAQMEAEDFPEIAHIDDTSTEHVQLGSVDAAKPQVGTSKDSLLGHLTAFRVMKNLIAEEVTIAFVGERFEAGFGANNMLQITARGTSIRVALAAIDLVDRRRGTLNSQGAILLSMIQGLKLNSSSANVAKIARLRVVFKKHLGIDNPFYIYRQSAGWEPRFKIEDKRGAADDRARDDAERRTVSLEQLSERGIQLESGNPNYESLDRESDAVDEWLKNNDPNESA
jgi:hypothetical protein